MYTYSKEHLKYLSKIKKNKILILLCQISITILFLCIWEFLVHFKIINSFLYSSPVNVYKCLINLYKTNSLFNHIFVTLYETIISFLLASLIGLITASILWWNKTLAKIFEPYLTIINSLPKVALGPLILIWIGANPKSIIFMALMISTIISIINIYNAFVSTSDNYITLMKSFNASKIQIFNKVIFPCNLISIINTLKINISMTLIGVVMGELLVSKKGLGYLIMYGSQVFNIDLVISSVFVLGVLSCIMYYAISYIEKKLVK